jgi:hypothetical protein
MGNLSDIFPPPASSNVLEVIQGSSDGRTINLNSNSYALQNVTSKQFGTTSYATVTGSPITYTPPENSKYVLYRFDMKWGSRYRPTDNTRGSTGISHYYIDVDGTVVTKSKTTISGNYSGNHGHFHQGWTHTFYWVFDLTASTDNASQGKFTNWSSDKTISVKFRDYNSTYRSTPHSNYWRDGTSIYNASDLYSWRKPTLTVIAYG